MSQNRLNGNHANIIRPARRQWRRGPTPGGLATALAAGFIVGAVVGLSGLAALGVLYLIFDYGLDTLGGLGLTLVFSVAGGAVLAVSAIRDELNR